MVPDSNDDVLRGINMANYKAAKFCCYLSTHIFTNSFIISRDNQRIIVYSRCVPNDFTCDGEKQCLDGSDVRTLRLVSSINTTTATLV